MVHVIDLLGAIGEKDSATQMELFVSQRYQFLPLPQVSASHGGFLLRWRMILFQICIGSM